MGNRTRLLLVAATLVALHATSVRAEIAIGFGRTPQRSVDGNRRAAAARRGDGGG